MSLNSIITAAEDEESIIEKTLECLSNTVDFTVANDF